MSYRVCTCLILTVTLSHAFALAVRGADELASTTEIQLLNVFGDDPLAADNFAAQFVTTLGRAEASQPRPIVDGANTLLPGTHTVLTSVNDPETETSAAVQLGTSPRDRLSLTSTKSDSDVISELESIAIWSGVVILLAGGVLVAIKGRHPAWGTLNETNSLQRVAALQLRPDAQLMLISADQRRYIIALDRQGIRFLEPISRWESGPLVDDLADTDVMHSLDDAQFRNGAR